MPGLPGLASSSTRQPCCDCFSLTIFKPVSSGDGSSWQPVRAIEMPPGVTTESVLLNAASEETSSIVTLPPVVKVRSVALAVPLPKLNASMSTRNGSAIWTDRELDIRDSFQEGEFRVQNTLGLRYERLDFLFNRNARTGQNVSSTGFSL